MCTPSEVSNPPSTQWALDVHSSISSSQVPVLPPHSLLPLPLFSRLIGVCTVVQGSCSGAALSLLCPSILHVNSADPTARHSLPLCYVVSYGFLRATPLVLWLGAAPQWIWLHRFSPFIFLPTSSIKFSLSCFSSTSICYCVRFFFLPPSTLCCWPTLCSCSQSSMRRLNL